MAENIQWSSNLHTVLNQPQNNNPGSVLYEFAFPLPSLGSHLDLSAEALSQYFQLPSNQSSLSIQTAPIVHASEAQASDYGPDFYHGPQNEPNGSFSSFGAKLTQIGTLNPYDLLVNNNPNSYDGASNIFQDFSSVPSNAGMSPTFALPVSEPDPPWARSFLELATSNQTRVGLELKSKKRQRALVESLPFSQCSAKNKRQKRTAATCSDDDQIGAVEAAFFEDWLSKFPSVYPGEKHFKALAELTPQPLNVETVRSWFAQKWHRSKTMSVGPKKRPIEASAMAGTFSVQASRRHVARPVSHSLLTGVLEEAATWVRDHKRTKCALERDLALLTRDPDKPYCCTLKCGQNFKDKDDWRKHEEVNYPQEGWVCDLGSVVVVDGRTLCSFCGIHNPSMGHVHDGKRLCHNKAMNERGRLHYRKQHFIQHFNNIHSQIPRAKYLESNHFAVESKFPRLCGFCPYRFTHWRDRIDHIGDHYAAGKEVIQWQEIADENDKDDNESGASDDDCHRGSDGSNSGEPDNMSSSSDDDSGDNSDDSSGLSESQQRCHESNGRRYSPQGSHLAAFLLFCSSLLRAEHVTRLDGITAVEFLPITSLTETPYIWLKLMRHRSKLNVDDGRDILKDTDAPIVKRGLTTFSSLQINPGSNQYSHPPMLPYPRRTTLANRRRDQSSRKSTCAESEDEIYNNFSVFGVATGQSDALVDDIEIGVDARGEDVGPSAMTSHGSGRPHLGINGAVEESEMLTEIERLRIRTTYLEDSNRDLKIAVQVAEASIKDSKADCQSWKEECAKLDAGKYLVQYEVDRMQDELRKKNQEIEELTKNERELNERLGRAIINNVINIKDKGILSSTMDSGNSRTTGSTSHVPSTITLEGGSSTVRGSNMRKSISSQDIDSSYTTGGPAQLSSQHHYMSQSQSAPLLASTSLRASSGAWTLSDDSTLMQARAQGLNWAPIQAAYFPSKTPNACRKRHERLMERRDTDDWDAIRFENFAKEYMGMRREIWSSLATRIGEKWAVLEAKCMCSGIMNLQSASRACARRERLENGGSLESHRSSFSAYGSAHTDDSTIGIEDLEDEDSLDSGSFGSLPHSKGMQRHPPYGIQKRLPSIDRELQRSSIVSLEFKKVSGTAK